VLTTDANLQVGARLATLSHGPLHELADAISIDGSEWILRQDTPLDVVDQEACFSIVAADAERRLR
jgi:hypothetical protein